MADATQDIFEIAVVLRDDSFYVTATGKLTGMHGEAGPFHSETEAQRAADDLNAMALSLGGIDLPLNQPN